MEQPAGDLRQRAARSGRGGAVSQGDPARAGARDRTAVRAAGCNRARAAGDVGEYAVGHSIPGLLPDSALARLPPSGGGRPGIHNRMVAGTSGGRPRFVHPAIRRARLCGGGSAAGLALAAARRRSAAVAGRPDPGRRWDRRVRRRRAGLQRDGRPARGLVARRLGRRAAPAGLAAAASRLGVSDLAAVGGFCRRPARAVTAHRLQRVPCRHGAVGWRPSRRHRLRPRRRDHRLCFALLRFPGARHSGQRGLPRLAGPDGFRCAASRRGRSRARLAGVSGSGLLARNVRQSRRLHLPTSRRGQCAQPRARAQLPGQQ